MANCPKCDYHLKKTYWKPNCPNCNVNIFYHGMEERLIHDAETAEVSLEKMYRALDRGKSSYIGAKRALARFICSLLAIGSLFVPFFKITSNGAFLDKTINISFIQVYNYISSADFGSIFKGIGSDVLGKPYLYYFLALVFMAIGAVGIILHFILLFMSCAPKGNFRNILLSSIGFIGITLSTVFAVLMSSNLSTVIPGAFAGSFSWGYPILAVFSIVPLAIDLYIKKKPVAVIDGVEKRKKEVAEKAAKMRAHQEEAQKAAEEQALLEKAYAEEHPELNADSKEKEKAKK